VHFALDRPKQNAFDSRMPKSPSPKSTSSGALRSPIQTILEDLHRKLQGNREGEVATYIPELGKADPEWFGLCLVTADGYVYEAGDTSQHFTIQSISKPFVYGIALEDNGKSKVLEKIWMEPSGEAFNAISLRPVTGQPANPMINAGAIATTSLAEGKTAKQKIHRILDAFGRYTGRKLEIDQSVYHSESSTGHRNRAIGYMLRNFDIIEEDPTPSLEAYFMQCSISVTCRDLGIMAATLANGGVNPVTGIRAVVGDYVENILSVMGSCGMYDAAGEWIYNVGMPAKSGVAGGILAVLPGQLGIGVFSPRLDSHGNSVRGIAACREISKAFDLHMFQVPRLATSVLRRTTTLAQKNSNRLRSPEESAFLREAGAAVRILELQGELVFGSAELATRQAGKESGRSKGIVIDLAHVSSIDFSACHVFSMAITTWLQNGLRVALSHSGHLPLLAKILRKDMGDGPGGPVLSEDLDRALEQEENLLLEEAGLRRLSRDPVPLASCELLEGMSGEELAVLKKLLHPRHFKENETLIRAGDPAGSLYFLMRGKASAWIRVGPDRERRVATFSPGMSFGEMALLDKAPRSAEVRADSDLDVLELGLEDFDQLTDTHPKLHLGLMRNLSCILARRLRAANIELSAVYA
jgi:glutaminase